jgi:ATP-dependent Lon protease
VKRLARARKEKKTAPRPAPARGRRIKVNGDPPSAPPLSGPRVVRVLPVRDTVVFPFGILPLGAGREKGVRLLNDAVAADRTIAVFMQKGEAEDPPPSDLHAVGALCQILRMVRMPDGQVSAILQGTARVRIAAIEARDPYLTARVEPLDEIEVADVETEALAKTLLDQFARVVALSPQVADEAVATARAQSSPGRLADFVASLLDLPAEDRQRLLEALDVKQRLQDLHGILARELQVLEVGHKIQEQVRESLDERQKEFVLRQQLEAIQKELGEGDDSQREVSELKARIEKAQMPPEVRKEADRELARLGRIPPQAPEYTVARTYLEYSDMPWAITTEDDLTQARARAGQGPLASTRSERILEYLAVPVQADARPLIFRSRAAQDRQDFAWAAGRPRPGAVRASRWAACATRPRSATAALHRPPGHHQARALRRAGTRNPLFMLDEIDKLGSDFRGDPASALLEVLDPAQNNTFMDHYLDVPFDLSQVLFVTTANYLDPVPPALRDRMEVIELTGYTDAEKLEIAKRHLIPRTIRRTGSSRWASRSRTRRSSRWHASTPARRGCATCSASWQLSCGAPPSRWPKAAIRRARSMPRACASCSVPSSS